MSGMAPFFILACSVLLLLVGVVWFETRTAPIRQTVRCPERATEARVVLQGRRHNDRGALVGVRITACSFQPGGVTCDQACLQGLRNVLTA